MRGHERTWFSNIIYNAPPEWGSVPHTINGIINIVAKLCHNTEAY
jgi:hypothetical protein